jgi:putative ABC transport system substrate-binding protein
MDSMRGVAKEIVRSGTDVVFATGTAWVEALLQESRQIPIVFALVSDPVGKGFVASLARPGGNVTGFSNLEPSVGGKWLETLRALAPRIRRCAMMFHPNPAVGQGTAFVDYFEAAASTLDVTPVGMPVLSKEEIKTAIAALGSEAGSGLVVMSDQFLTIHRGLIVNATAIHNVPAIYPFRNFVVEGGLISYGVSAVDLYRRSASYVDLILRGERTSELPVQRPTKFDLVINLKVVRALGLEVPPTLLSLADEVIE